MQGPSGTTTPGSSRIHEKISRQGYSARQVALLQGLHGLCADEFDRRLEYMLDELEKHLFQSAEQARSNEVQRALLESQKQIRSRRGGFKQVFLTTFEGACATLSEPTIVEVKPPATVQFSELSLVDTSAMDEAVALKEIATRCEIRNSLALFLLGQRMGVVARAPAFDAERLPIGPRRICEVLRQASAEFELDAEQRGLVYRQFDRSVVQSLTPFFEALNNYLIGEGILPHLTYVPPRSKQAGQRQHEGPHPVAMPTPEPEPVSANTRTAQTPLAGQAALPGGAPDMRSIPSRGGGMFAAQPGALGAGSATATATATAPAARQRGIFPPAHPLREGVQPGAQETAPLVPVPTRPVGHETLPWSHAASEGPERPGGDVELFDTLRRLLAGRRGLLDRLRPARSSGPAATAAQVQDSLAHVQQRYNARADNGSTPSFADIRRDLSLQMQRDAADGVTPALSPEQGDTVDLVGMLFEQIAQEVSPQSPGGVLLAQLQLPLLRVALQDEAFFTDRNHPARRMLEVVAETSAYWSGEDDVDRDLIQRMSMLVHRVNEEPESDPSLFRDLMSDLTGHLTTQQRKAELSERRHVEAARGREKLEIARLKAEESIEQLLGAHAVPKFLQTLLEQVWVDVLALALLRGGEEAPAFRQHFGQAQRLVEASTSGPERKPLEEAEVAPMRSELEVALAQVGYTGNDAGDICTRLLSVATPADAAVEGTTTPAVGTETASRTELTLKLRDRDRLGEDVHKEQAKAVRKVERAAPLSAEEAVWHERLKRMPYGTWFEFTINQQGDKARRRMSWFSSVTDHCMFVNHRGQRAGDYTLSWVAREINRGNVSLVEPDNGSVVERAWKAIVSTLRAFSGGAAAATP